MQSEGRALRLCCFIELRQATALKKGSLIVKSLIAMTYLGRGRAATGQQQVPNGRQSSGLYCKRDGARTCRIWKEHFAVRGLTGC